MVKYYKLLLLPIAVVFFNSVKAQWVTQLPPEVQDQIHWLADHEEGDLTDWTLKDWLYPGGGIFNTGGSEVEVTADNSFAHSGEYAVRATITNAWQAQNGSRAVRLMRWTDTAWDNDGNYFPEASYYSAFYYFPSTYNPNKYAPWDPGDGGWWNIFQFKSDAAADESQPIWTLNVDYNDTKQQMSLYLYSKYNPPHSYGQIDLALSIPTNQWVHIEAFYKASTANTANGTITIWQDGQRILDVPNVVTTLDSEQVVWGIGNYTDHIAGGPVPGTADLYFDDCIVSGLPVHPYLDATSPVGGADNTTLQRRSIYPNPSTDWLHLNFTPDQPTQIVNSIGVPMAYSITNAKIDVSGLHPGLYHLLHGKQVFSFVKH